MPRKYTKTEKLILMELGESLLTYQACQIDDMMASVHLHFRTYVERDNFIRCLTASLPLRDD